MACVDDRLDGMLVIKVGKSERVKAAVLLNGVCGDDDGRLTLTATFGVGQRLPKVWTVL